MLNYILSSLSPEIMSQVATTTPMAAVAWATIEGMFAAPSRARVINTRMALATTQKGTSTVAEYFTQMKALADEMASTGKKLDDEGISSYILVGLDIDFNPLVSAIAARVEPLTLGELLHLDDKLRVAHGSATCLGLWLGLFYKHGLAWRRPWWRQWWPWLWSRRF